MAFRFKPQSPLNEELLRIGHEQLEHAVKSLAARNAAAATHETRKCIKRLRALLRLVRPGIGKPQYKALNHTLRTASQLLSGDRDRDVLLGTAKLLCANERVPAAAVRRLCNGIDRMHRDSGTAKARTDRRQQAAELLEAAKLDLDNVVLDGEGFAPIERGLEAGLQELARAAEASRGGDDESYHDLRKAVQRHWRHMRLVEAGWPAYFQARAQAAKEISELLGTSQDLTLLIGVLDTRLPASFPKADADALRRQAVDLRADVREQARNRLALLLIETPRGYARRASEYWAATGHLAHASEGGAEKHDSEATPKAGKIPASKPARRRQSPRKSSRSAGAVSR